MRTALRAGLRRRAGRLPPIRSTGAAPPTPTEACPISRCYRPSEFVAICAAAGLRAEFVGGYLSHWDLSSLEHLDEALGDDRLAGEHAAFLHRLERDEHGRPVFGGRYAGIGGTYRLTRS